MYKGYNLELLLMFIVQYLYSLLFAILISDAFCFVSNTNIYYNLYILYSLATERDMRLSLRRNTWQNKSQTQNVIESLWNKVSVMQNLISGVSVSC